MMKSTFSLVLLMALMSNLSAQSAEPTITDSLYSETLDRQQEYWVRLPENYNPDSRYPVVYLLDGFSLQQALFTAYDNYWGHYLPHMILVGVSNRSNRTLDLTTSQISSRRGAGMDEETGGAEQFSQFLIKELMPYVETKFAASPYRTLIGHSYSGLFTVNMLVNHREQFANYIAIDPSMDWDGQKLLLQAKEEFAKGGFEGKFLFVSLAAEQLHMWDEKVNMDNLMDDISEFTLFARSIVELTDLCQSNDELNFSWKVYPEDLHGTVPLPSMIDGLVEVFKWYQFKSPQKYNNPATSVDEIEKMLEEQAAIYAINLGYEVPPMVEELFSGYGYMNLQMEQPEKARMFFQKNLDYYPTSATAFDSMADYYVAMEDKENALKMVIKAYQLSKTPYFEERIKELSGKD